MASETQLLWEITIGLGVVVLAVVILLLALLRESVRSLLGLVAEVWSSAVSVFVHTVTVPNQLRRAEVTVRSFADAGPRS
jgi:hypothetical protein